MEFVKWREIVPSQSFHFGQGVVSILSTGVSSPFLERMGCMLRFLRAALLLLVVSTTLTSCGRQSDGPTAPSAAAATDRVTGTIVEIQTEQMQVDGPMVIIVEQGSGPIVKFFLPGPMQPDVNVQALYEFAGTLRVGERIAGSGKRQSETEYLVTFLERL